jgi:hypothetical protein
MKELELCFNNRGKNLSADECYYLARLISPYGIPVGVLNAGSSLSPRSFAFILKTWTLNGE